MIDYLVRAVLIVLCLVAFGKYKSVLAEETAKVINVLLFDINPNFYIAIIVLIMLLLLLLAINMYKTNKEIERHSYVVYKTEEEYEAEKNYLTRKHLSELKKHPRFKAVREESLRLQKERKQAEAQGEKRTSAGSMFLYEDSD